MDIKQEMNILVGKITDLRDNFSAYQKDINLSVLMIDSLSKAIDKELADKKNEKEAIDSEILKLNEEVEIARTKLATLIADGEAEINRQKQEFDRVVSQENERLATEDKRMNEKRHALTKDIETYNANQLALNEDIAKNNDLRSNAQSLIAEYQSKLKALENIKQKTDELKAVESNIINVRNELVELKSSINKDKEEAQKIVQKINSESAKNKEKTQIISEYEKQIADLKEINKKNAEYYIEEEKKLLDLKKSVEDECNAMRKNLNDKEANLENLHQELIKAKEKIEAQKNK